MPYSIVTRNTHIVDDIELIRFIDDIIMSDIYISSVIQLISTNAALPIDSIQRLFKSFLYYQYRERILKRVSAIPKSTIKRLLRELAGERYGWHGKYWLKGVSVGFDCKIIRINDSLAIRRPVPDDYNNLFWSHMSSTHERLDPHNPPALIAELDIPHGGTMGGNPSITGLINALRHFMICSPVVVFEEYTPLSVTGVPSQGFTVPINTPIFSGVLIRDNIRTFIKYAHKHIADNIGTARPRKKDDYWDIAYKRYSDALYKRGSTNSIIADAVIALEALVLHEEDELAFKIRNRIAILLSCIGYDPLTAAKIVKEAYDVRSKYVHGSSKQVIMAKDQCERILDLVRICIEIFKEMKDSGTEKNKMVEMLDRAMIDNGEYAKLKSLIRASRWKKRRV